MIRFSCNLQFSGRSSVSINRDLYNIKKVEDLRRNPSGSWVVQGQKSHNAARITLGTKNMSCCF